MTIHYTFTKEQLPEHMHALEPSFTHRPQRLECTFSLEYLTIRPLILLAINLDWLVPAPLIIHKLLVLGLAGI